MLDLTTLGSTRGPDLNSWWQNRAARRQEINQVVTRLRDAQQRLSKAAAHVKFTVSLQPAIDLPDDILRQADATLTAIQSGNQQALQLAEAVKAEQATLAAAQEAVERSAQRNARNQAEEDARKANSASVAASKVNQGLRRICATGIFLGVLFVLFEY